jgi:hypothetical protein
MRRQESTQVEGKSAGRNEAEMKSEKQQVYRQKFSHSKSHLRFAPPAVVALGGSGAAHRMHQNERPPLPGLPLSAARFIGVLTVPLAAVSAPFSRERRV